MNARSAGSFVLDVGALLVGVALAPIEAVQDWPVFRKVAKWGGLAAVLLLVVLTSACDPHPIPAEHFAAVTR